MENWQNQYSVNLTDYTNLNEEVVFIIKDVIKKQNILLHTIESRIKTIDSIARKAEQNKAKNPLEELDDICGIRVICLFRSDISKITKIIIDNLKIDTIDDKMVSSPDDSFGYISVHLKGTLPQNFKGPRYDNLKAIKFEVQVRTIAMHSWATISHYLDYKSPNAIPKLLRKDFHALSALFYLADSEFERFYIQSEQSKETSKELVESSEKVEINFDSVQAFLDSFYPDRQRSSAEVLSELIEELIYNGYQYIYEIEKELIRGRKAFEEYEKERKQKQDAALDKPLFRQAATARLSLSISNPNFLVSYPEGYTRNKILTERLIARLQKLIKPKV